MPHRFIDAGLISLGVCFFQPVQAAEVGSQSGINITVNSGDSITANTSDSNSILYGAVTPRGDYPGHVDLGNNVTIDVSAPNGSARGVSILSNGSSLSADRLNVNATGANAVGIELSGAGGSADLGTGSIIKSTGSTGTGSYMAQGVSVRNNSSLLADELSIETSGDFGIGSNTRDYGSRTDLGSGSQIKTRGRSSYAVYVDGLNGNSANGNAWFKATDLSIDTEGYAAYGLNAQKNSVVDLGTNSVLNIGGDYAHGIWSFGELSANALSVSTTGVSANGIEVRGGTANIGAGSHVSSEQGGGLVASGTGATLNYIGTAAQRNSVVSGGNFGVSAQSKMASINVQNTDIAVDKKGAMTLGLWALNGGAITGENLTITGAEGALGVYAITDSQIDLTNDLVITMHSADQAAISTQHNEGYAASRINASGHMLINGGVFSRGGAIDLDMTPGSVWTGAAFTDNVNGGKLDVAINKGVWNVTSDSSLDALKLTDSAVDFASHASSASPFSTLTVANLSGNGTFVMRTDIAGEGNGVNNAGDLLNITGSSAGDHVLTIRNQGSLATTGKETLTVVKTPDGVGSFTPSSKVELGGYLYDVRKNGTDWELYSSASTSDPVKPADPTEPTKPTDPVKPVTPVKPPTPPITTAANAGGNYLNVGYLLNYEENRTLMQRMGDMRNLSKEGDMWIRSYGGQFDSFSGGSLSGFDMNYSGLQIGADKRVSEMVPVYVGLFIGSTHGSPDYRGGNGTARSDYTGMYASYFDQSGFYSDAVLKVSRQKYSFRVLDTQNNAVSANGSSSGYSTSVEVGNKFSLTSLNEGLYVEPQAQLSYSYQQGMPMAASNGLDISLGHYKSLLARASILLGYDVTTANSQVNMYVKTGGIREYAGDTDYRLNNAAEGHTFQGNGWNNGLGASAQFDEQHSVYLEADYTLGETFNQKQINGGYRFSF